MAGIRSLINLNVINALEEAQSLIEANKRHYFPFKDPFEECTDKEFVKLYRLPKILVEDLIDVVQPHMVYPSRVSALSISRQVLCALRFFASGSYQMDIAKGMHHSISQSSMSKSLHAMVNALNSPEILNKFVQLPRDIHELQRLKDRFYQKHQFPGIVGCLDCTHVAIVPPSENEAAYVNRKGYHSINVQLICDPDLKILNVCARYPGSCHDSYIWSNSKAFNYIRNLHLAGHTSFSFLGDSGYALRPWTLTPITHVQPGSSEENYNRLHGSTRSLIERCNGVLKMRFRCLLKHRVLHYNPETACKIINSCVVLHNICISNKVDLNNEAESIMGYIEMMEIITIKS